jgi:hypothetical protein
MRLGRGELLQTMPFQPVKHINNTIEKSFEIVKHARWFH